LPGHRALNMKVIQVLLLIHCDFLCQYLPRL
jgi:hypothetical protein